MCSVVISSIQPAPTVVFGKRSKVISGVMDWTVMNSLGSSAVISIGIPPIPRLSSTPSYSFYDLSEPVQLLRNEEPGPDM